ncbi:hypothetical protein HFZ78_24180 [Priestia megaterium]|uniref:Uncharacterized protein n=1 Tax=Priestia megaterium TaxID=1404 RepID=A0A6H1P812_PRIMG|nr:hypothetical protein [Priestia megaterium]QIZ09401.1 hypothetical protein HFZ78_24180 [Priestia megaterium]
MGLDMYLVSLPNITGMDYDEIVLASAQMSKHKADQDEIYEKLKPHIKHNGEDDPLFTQEVTKENLLDLNNLCLQVLKEKDSPCNILPTRPGCFFGNLSYDSYYYREIEETQALLAALIKHFNFETHYLLYQCSW